MTQPVDPAPTPEDSTLVRGLQSGDLDPIMRIEATAFHPMDADTRETMENSWADYPDGFLVAVNGSQVVGYLMSRPRGNAAYIHSMAVDGEWRGRGIGRQLLQTALDRYACHGFKQAELEVRPDNLPAVLAETCFSAKKARKAAATLSVESIRACGGRLNWACCCRGYAVRPLCLFIGRTTPRSAGLNGPVQTGCPLPLRNPAAE